MLSVTDLSVSYGAIAALNGISLEIPAGAIVTLVGGNGAGKTTTLHTISGLLRAKAGRIEFQGEDITGLPAHQVVARGLGHVPEGRMVFSNLTVGENLAMGAYLLKDPMCVEKNRAYVFSIFPRLQERLKQTAGTLSGGEQQMLAIGRALMGRPRLLLLDEPSLGLSPKLADEVLAAVRVIIQDGTAVLLAEQNVRKALTYCERAYVLEIGKVVLSGATSALRDTEEIRRAYLGD